MKPDVIVKIGTEKYKTEITVADHHYLADEPTTKGGNNLGAEPTSFLLTALGSCKAITMRMYADLKNWPLEEAEINLQMEVDQTQTPPMTTIKVTIKLIGDLDDMQRERILKVADKCPVHKILSNPITIATNLIA